MNTPSLFPIESQTSDTDKQVLVQIRELLQSSGAYSYLEIGSYLGGSLTPFLSDEKCIKILSIDERERQQPDERGAKYDYAGITHDTMLTNLENHGFELSKIEVFNGSVSQYNNLDRKYDFIFIDGEHTDWACFRDFIHSEKLCNKDCIVAFHDTNLVYKSIRIINELVGARGSKCKFIKVKNSAMSCLFFNKFSEIDLNNLFKAEENIDQYYSDCEAELLLATVRNRVTIHKQWLKEATFSIREAPTFKQ